MRSIPFLLAAFLQDTALALVFAALPFRATELGAGPVSLGLLPTLYAAGYMLSASLGGRVSDRVPRLALVRRAGLAFSVVAASLAFADRLGVLFALLPLAGLALGFYWSPLQAALADEAPAEDLSRSIGRFNVAWCLGKGSGIVFGGLLTAAFSPVAVLSCAAVPGVLIALVLARHRSSSEPAVASRDVASAFASRPPRFSATFLRLAWMTNALAYGVVGTVNMHAPRLLREQGGGPAEFGLVFGAVFLVQTLTFAAHGRRATGPRALLASLALAVVGLCVFVGSTSLGGRLLATLPLGLAIGLAYHASLQASLDRATGRGRAAGWHETILGAGSSTLPLLGGAAASITGRAAAPFGVALGVVATGAAIAATLRGGRRVPAEESRD
ncbi:MAG: MFS transporter [Gemmatimonadetes bacterium]|nr:MFS transporter [Gemmatimonadota bacterium]